MMKTPNFEKAAGIVLSHEAGYVNDPNDPGGETKYGISKRSYPREDIKNLTEEGALRIYYEDFWVECGAEDMPYAIALCVFDFAINSGVAKAVMTLQRSLNAINGSRLAEDGYWGNKTKVALSSSTAKNVIKEINSRRVVFMSCLSIWDRFKLGWTRRVFNLTTLAVEDLNVGSSRTTWTGSDKPR